jgi:hypothetical protein
LFLRVSVRGAFAVRAWAIALLGAALFIPAHLLSAQSAFSRPTTQSLVATASPFVGGSPGSQILVAQAAGLPIATAWNQFGSAARAALTPPPVSYRPAVNLGLPLPDTPGTTRVGAQETYRHGIFSIGRMKLGPFTFRPTYTAADRQIIHHDDELEYYAHHVPLVGGIMLQALHQSKIHPRVTRVLETIQPQF